MGMLNLFRRKQRFERGDRVQHIETGWTGTVTGEPSDSGLIWCVFDQVGQYGADARLLIPNAKGSGDE